MKKTQKEVERDLNRIIFLSIILTMCLFIVVLLGLGSYWDNQNLKQNLSKCQGKIGMLENVKLTPNTFSYWQYDGNEYSNYVCVGDFYINGNQIKIPENLDRVEIGYWKGIWVWDFDSNKIYWNYCYNESDQTWLRENCEVINIK